MVEVTVYSKPNCVQCKFTKDRLDQKGIPFTEIDLTQDEDSLRLVKYLGYSEAPVVSVGDMHWGGFKPEKIDRMAQAMSSTFYEDLEQRALDYLKQEMGAS